MDKLNQVIKGAIHFLFAGHYKGHGIHSPAVFEFVTKVLADKTHFPAFELVEGIVELLKTNKQEINIDDFGAGSDIFKSNRRKVCDIARYSGCDKKTGQLLYRMASFYNPEVIIELGTSLGISAMYMAKALPDGTLLHTVEGSNNLTILAEKNIELASCNNIVLYHQRFEQFLQEANKLIKNPAIVYIDGNHSYSATLEYFRYFDKHIAKGFIIFDDIYWSRDMEKAWKVVQKQAGTTVDLFSLGIVFKGDMLTPGNYKIRF
ncbi:MAG: class I SAM-dependent methyltransferase [Bacteroidales bacterium]|nr:class I SAM-dependent methyltransferase [Bacteroidales bacterium]